MNGREVQKYVADGRWRLAGSWIDAVDPNMPSPESLFRQALYGQRFYRQEFNGKVSHDVYLPDSFGFGFALPSIAAHSGLNSFSTQKLTWGRPIPFPIGRWKGVDGSEIIAALNPGSYATQIREDMTLASTNGGRAGGPPWLNDPTLIDGRRVEFRYFGTGDTGGAPTEASVQFLQKALSNPDPNLEIRNVAPDQLAKDLSPEARALLPVYNDELILKTHGTGCYTSQSAMKTFNRANEILAEAAEKASVAAGWLAGAVYPSERLRGGVDPVPLAPVPRRPDRHEHSAGVSVLLERRARVAESVRRRAHATPRAPCRPARHDRRRRAARRLQPGVDGADRGDRGDGEARRPPAAVQRRGRRRPARPCPRRSSARPTAARASSFVGTVPSLGYRVFNVTRGNGGRAPTALKVSPTSLENNRISVKIDQNGDISSIYDKDAKHELLKAPIMLELRDNPSPSWPAWEVLYDTVQSPAREYVADPTIKVIEHGPARVALEITRKAAGSTFVQRIRLAQGADRVDVENLIDWRSPNSLLKASFPFTASNPKAVYDLGLGTIERGNNVPDQYEVPAQRWAGIDDASGTFGVAVINDSRHGWDKPNDSTLAPDAAAHAAAEHRLHLPEQQRSRPPSHRLSRSPVTRAIGGRAASR